MRELPKQPSRLALAQVWQQRWKHHAGIFFVALTVFTLIWFFFYSSVFRVRSVAIEGVDAFYGSRIQAGVARVLNEKKYFIIPQNNYFLLPEEHILRRIKNEIYLSNISITKQFPNGITLSGTATHTAYALAVQGDLYIANDDGIIITKIIPENLQPDIPLVVVDGKPMAEIGERILTTDASTLLLQITDALGDKLDVIINDYRYRPQDKENIVATTTEGWKIYFSAKEDALYQVEELTQLLTKSVRERTNIDYIDLRVHGWAYIQER